MDRVEQAVESFKGGFSCSQAILATYGEGLGLAPDTALKLADGFGGGIAGTGLTCGAVTAAVMVIGLKYGRTSVTDTEAKAKTVKLVRDFLKEFKSRRGSTVCEELLGSRIDTPEKRQIVSDKGLFATVCPEAVRGAAELLETML